MTADTNPNAATTSPRGVCIFFTGLSGSGKTTLASALDARIRAETARATTLLDGDIIRTHLSSELGFSREHRDLNIQRIGFVASEVVKHGGFVIVSAIAPFDGARKSARGLVEPLGRFYLVHLATPLNVCEARDVKGLYAKARAGLLAGFTGVSDPYEAPADADLTIDTSAMCPSEAVAQIVDRMRIDGAI